MLKNRRASGFIGAALLAAASLVAICPAAMAEDVKVVLNGDQEVPAVATEAKGEGIISIAADKSVKVRITTTGVDGVAAHVHLAARGKNGPPVITLVKSGDNEWSAPAGAKLSDEQYASFKAGALYVNVHSANHKGGEIRGQLQP
jgi:hypothetical protein